MKIILATQNKGKLNEFTKILSHQKSTLEFELKPLSEDIGEIQETGKTYLENALVKANKVFSCYRQPVLSDDSGLELINFDNIPGLFSARYAGENATDSDNRIKLKDLLINNSISSTPARYRCILVYKPNEKEYFSFESTWEGRIVLNKEEVSGFGYDTMFIPNSFECTADKLSDVEKSKFSHRAEAVRKLIEFLGR
ncbi:RdgB/HAM1 family non-canonical purine NTP pyrophosphatase [Xenorhabdus nematophila]|uniref:RdgB/HAM1 family non-canonical purine NTP pyrophosphatase n=1 Tax=Xenorhabdus nematophila TaxID=628 RepID=UPI0032B81E78